MTNLVEILKNAPKRLELYSPVYGRVKLETVNEKLPGIYKIAVTVIDDKIGWGTLWFDEYGRVDPDGECCLFPSKENKNWDTWQKILFKPNYFITITGPKYNLTVKVQQYGWKDENKNTRFATIEEIENWYRKNNLFKSEDCIAESLVEFTIDDFKPFDKVLAKDYGSSSSWRVDIFSHYQRDPHPIYICVAHCWRQCVPYNDETKHLLGTTEEYNGKYKTW